MDKHSDLAASLLELVIFCALVSILTCSSLIGSAQIAESGNLQAQAKIIQGLISNSISSATQQNTKLTLSLTTEIVQLFKNSVLVDQHKLPKSMSMRRRGQEDTNSWTEYIYPTGSQSPFTLELIYKSKTCLISVSLRGRVNRKCI